MKEKVKEYKRLVEKETKLFLYLESLIKANQAVKEVSSESMEQQQKKQYLNFLLRYNPLNDFSMPEKDILQDDGLDCDAKLALLKDTIAVNQEENKRTFQVLLQACPGNVKGSLSSWTSQLKAKVKVEFTLLMLDAWIESQPEDNIIQARTENLSKRDALQGALWRSHHNEKTLRKAVLKKWLDQTINVDDDELNAANVPTKVLSV